MTRLRIRSAFTGRAARAAVVAILFIVVPAIAVSGTQASIGPPEQHLDALMKRIGFLKAQVTYLQGDPLAPGTPWSWTESKAARMVKRDARVMVPAAERTLLERELRDSI